VPGERVADESDGALERRIFRVMVSSVVAAVMASFLFASWRVTVGLALGGGLSLLSHHWLRTSVAAVFNVKDAERPRVKASRYLVRYFVIGLVVLLANWSQVISLPATIAGLCSFVPALMVEALRQFFLVIIHREESN
jgi:hypothetical protein